EDEEREGELEGGERESGEDRDPESLLAPEEAQELAAEDGQGGPEDRPAGAGGAGHGAGFYCRVPLDCLDCPTKQPYQRRTEWPSDVSRSSSPRWPASSPCMVPRCSP